MKKHGLKIFVLYIFIAILTGCSPKPDKAILPGTRTLLDAHNCYPYHGKWTDRIDRALGTGLPLAIEQDLVWFTDSLSGKSWSIVAHGKPYTGREPTLKNYFFERIRPLVEQAFRENKKQNWPLIILNLDFKTNEPEHLIAIRHLMGEYEDWLCTVKKGEDIKKGMPLEVKPVLVLCGSSDEQKKIFYDAVKEGEKLRLFGAIKTYGDSVEVPPQKMAPEGIDNYHRWWNNSWDVIEKNRKGKAWTETDFHRLQALVDHAHHLGLWIRFYTLNGYQAGKSLGWSQGYNFGSLPAVKTRWQAAIRAGVDFVATDQYELFADYLAQNGLQQSPSGMK